MPEVRGKEEGRRGHRRRLEQLLHAEPSVKSLPPSPSFATAPNKIVHAGLGDCHFRLVLSLGCLLSEPSGCDSCNDAGSNQLLITDELFLSTL